MTPFALPALAVAVLVILVLAWLLWRSRRQLQEEQVVFERDTQELRSGRASMERRVGNLNELLAATESERSTARASERALRGLLDSLPLPVWQRGDDLTLTYCNRAYLLAVEQSFEQVLREGTELVEDPDRAQARQLAQRALESNQSEAKRFHIVVGGERRLMEVMETPLADGSLLGHARDVTEVEALEVGFQRYKEAQGVLLEHLGVGIAIYGADMHLDFYNTAYARIWRLDDSFLADKPHLFDLLEWLREHRRLPEQADFSSYKRQLLRNYQTLLEPAEELIHLPDGTTLRVTMTPHPSSGVILTYEDVTDRLQLERTYNTLLDVQRETLDNLHEGVAVFGADGRLKLYNPAFAQIWNLSLDWLGEQPHVRDVIHAWRSYFDLPEEGWQTYLEHMVARATEPETDHGQLERADASIVEWSQVALPDGASLFAYVDITDSTRVERALRERNEALETADRLKSEFIANISYELRTPLNATIGFAEILQNCYFGPLNERQQGYAQAIVESSERLIALINDILDLASIEAGYLQLDRKPVELNRLLESVEALWRERAHLRELKLEIHCEEGLDALYCDEKRLRQALFNLLSNAFRFTPDGGTIHLKAQRQDQEILLTVTDNGIGIPPEEQSRIFGQFERGRLSQNRRQRAGAGLGLSLVKSLIELHGGWVELASEVDRGTSVTCHLPLDPADPQAALPQAALQNALPPGGSAEAAANRLLQRFTSSSDGNSGPA
ncbi:sensor histidine kinase [Fodinicurvata sediminis]|uniref:sensor histidine kinase n=1 Tax=Fodinicurvata sediminis TaxID=1121832 RepID=UPI0003B40457|nr:PAS-domain containing protein [Fodinicurvata sediminis]